MEPEYYTPAEVAKRFRVTRAAVYKWISEGKLKSTTLGPRAIRISRSALEEFIQRAERGKDSQSEEQ
jgi:excisionase family DNA binding protein